MTTALHELALGEVARQCQRENQRYRQTRTSDSRFCLEIFRRALQRNGAPAPRPGAGVAYEDEEARNLLVELYTDYVKSQMGRRASSAWASADEVVQLVWFGFWQRANSGLQFDNLGGALAYLKSVTVSVVIKQQRDLARRRREESLQALTDTSGEPALPAPGTTHIAADLFETIQATRLRDRTYELLEGQVERLVYGLRYGQGYAPREIAQVLGEQGHGSFTARKVSDMLERIFERLAADGEIRALLQGD